MNAGQKLVELSGLSSGSALTHLLAITQGTGTGVDRVVFASRFSVSIEDSQMTLVQRSKKSANQAVEDDPPIRSSGTKKNVFVRTPEARIVVQTAIDEVVVTNHRASSITTKTYPQHVSVSRKRLIASI